MAFLDVVIHHEGDDISNQNVSYNREHVICTGIGSLELTVPLSIGRDFHPWDTIEIWENGNKVTPFYISSAKRDGAKGTITIQAQDTSKRLTDYFVTDTYLIDYLSYSKYWIELFLNEVGIEFGYLEDSTGVPLSNNTSLGFDSAYNIILTLLQQSGWYMFFDENGKAWIGELNKDMHDPDHTITNAVVMGIEREQDDERLRNRAVVWGNTNPVYGEVFVDISVHTPYNYDLDDKRAVVYANSSIFSNEQALELAQLLLKEFTKIKDEKVILLPNDYAIDVGDTAFLDVRGWSGTGLITTLVSSLSDKGLIYTLTIDEHCPRLFTFFSTMPPTISGFPVFVGTWGDGIWTRQVDDTTWYNSSTGLENLFIKDLFIKDGIFAATAGDGYLYARNLNNSWVKYLHPDLREIDGTVITAAGLQAEICSINPSNTIIAGYNTTVSGAASRSFILERDSLSNLITVDQVVVGGESNARIIDLEAGDGYNIVSVVKETVASGVGPGATGLGYRTINMFEGDDGRILLPPDTNSYSYGPPLGYTSSSTFYTGATGGSLIISSIIVEDDQKIWYLTINGLVLLDAVSGSSNKYSFITPSEWPTSPSEHKIQGVIRRKDSNTFTIVVFYGLTGETLHLRHYELTLSTSTLTQIVYNTVSTNAFNIRDNIIGGGLIEEHLVIQYWYEDTSPSPNEYVSKVINYSLTSHGLSNIEFDRFIKTSARGYKTVCSGDEIICLSAAVTYDGSRTLNCIGIIDPNGPIVASADVAFYRVGRFGSAGTGLINIGTLEADENSVIDTINSRLYQSGYGAADTTFGDAYVRYAVSLTRRECPVGGDQLSYYWAYGFSSYIRFPLGSAITHETGEVNYHDSFDDSTGSHGTVKSVDRAFFGLNWTHFNTIYSRYGNPYFISHIFSAGAVVLNDATNGSKLADVPDIGVTGSLIAKDDLDGSILTTFNTSPEGIGRTSGWSSVKSFDTSTKLTGTNTTSFYVTQDFVIEAAASTLSNNVRVWRYADPTPSVQPYGVYKHTHALSISGSTASDLATQQTQGNFELLYLSTVPLKVEISKGAPTVIYSIPAIGSSTNSILAASISNAPSSFYEHTEDKQVWEAKVFDLSNPSQFPTTSGVFTETDFERYIGIVNTQGLFASKYDLTTPWVKMANASGVTIPVNHLETTNYHPSGTYFFYSYSGAANFFQKNPTESVWRDYSAGLPSSEITIIRCDDLI